MKLSRWIAALAAIALFCVPARTQNSAAGNISASSTNCTSVPLSCVWEQPLPPNAATSTINISGTFSATLLVEESNNGGQTWSTAATLSSAGTTTYSTNGFTDIRVRCSAYVSGTAAVTISTGLNTGLQGPPGPGGGITQVSSLPGATFYAASSCPTATPYCFAINDDFQLDWNCSWTAGGTITCTDNPFLPTDAGKRVLSSTLAKTGFISYQTAVKQCTGTLTYTSSSVVVASGGCTSGSSGPLWWGTPDTTQMLAWSTAIMNGCASGTLPGVNKQGTGPSIIGISKGLWTSSPANCQGTVAANRSGVTITGQGTSASYILMLDDFDPTTCVGTTPACFGYNQVTAASDGGIALRDFTITGAGNGACGAGFNGKNLVLLTSNSYLDSFFALGMCGQQAGVVGVSFGTSTSVGPISGTNFSVDGFGRENCMVNHAGFVTFSNNSFCGDGVGPSLEIAGGASLISSGNIYGPSGGGFIGDILIDINGFMRSVGDTLDAGAGTSATLGVNNGGGTFICDECDLRMAVNSSASILNIGASAITRLKNTNLTMSGTSSASLDIQNGVLDNQGGNTISGAAGPYTATTTNSLFIADGHSFTAVGTGTCSASVTIGLKVSGQSTTGTGIPTTCTSTTLDAGVQMTGSRTLMNLVVHSTAVGVSGVVTVLKNGGATALTCSMAAVTFCTDGAHSVSVVSGDLISIQVATGAAETLANVKAYVEWN